MKPHRSTVEIELNPYDDGSGYSETVIAKRDGENVVVEIKQHDYSVRLSLEQWCAVRDSMDYAIKAAGGPDLGAGDLEVSSRVSVHNEQ